MFIPRWANPKYATYVRKNLGMKDRFLKSNNSGILSVLVEINGSNIEIIKIYAPSGKEATKFLADHKPDTNTMVSGDFNSHHAMCYADKAAEYADSIGRTRTNATGLVTWPTKYNLILQNELGTFSHFPHSN